MRKIIFVIYLLSFPFIVASQNLLLNPGFEDNSGLPTATAQWWLATDWSNANTLSGSPDYIHINGSGAVKMPNTVFGIINPYKGNAIMGLCLWNKAFANYREYLSQRLATPLIVGNSYTFSFYTSNGIQNNYGGTGIQNLQVDFSVNPINQFQDTPLGYTPLLSSGNIVYSDNWVKISYTFVATAPYTHFAIGNFMNDNNTVTQQFKNTGTKVAYYFFDEISLTLNKTIKIKGDSQICLGDTAILQASNSTTYAWADSLNPSIILSNDSIFTVSPATTTTYYVYGATDTALYTVNVFNPASVNLGNDKNLCQGEALTLDATTPNATYRWQDGSANSTFFVTYPGTYWVAVTVNKCTAVDTIQVGYKPYPIINLGKDTSLCKSQTLTLDATTPNATYLWQDKSTNSTYFVTQPGTYWVNVTVNNCTTNDRIVISKEICKTDLVVPNVFTPNNDGINDLFVPVKSEGIVSMNTIIYNRWGSKVFESNKHLIEWNGQGVSDGTYYWIIYYTDSNGVKGILKGYVTLLN